MAGQHDIDNLMAIAGQDRLFVNTDPVTSTIRSAFPTTLNDSSAHDTSFTPVRQNPIHEMRSSVKHRDLSISRAAADKVFADYANRDRVFTLGDQRHLTANFDDHLIDHVYDQLGNSFTELDDLHGNKHSVCDSRPIERRRS